MSIASPALFLQALHLPPRSSSVLPVLGRALPEAAAARPVDEQQVKGVGVELPDDALKRRLDPARACLHKRFQHWSELACGSNKPVSG